MKEEKIEEIKTKKDLFKNIFVDCVVGIFLIAGKSKPHSDCDCCLYILFKSFYGG